MRFYWFKIIKVIWTEFNNWQLFNPFFLLESGRGDHFRFGSVFIKKSNQTEIFFFEKKPKPNRNRVKPTGFGSVRFGFCREKTCSNRFGSVFPVWLGFGSVWLGFLSVSVRFGLVFSVFVYKTETEPAGFFKNLIGLIGFFFRFGFFGLIGFLVFLLTPRIRDSNA